MASPTINTVHQAGVMQMPYSSIDEANDAIKGIDPKVTLAQANLIADTADGMEDNPDVENPWATAIGQFKRTHTVKDGKWVKKSSVSKASLEERVRIIREAWYAKYKSSELSEYHPDNYWVKDVLDTSIIVETPSGLYQYPYTMTNDGVSFGEPSKVELVYQVTKSDDLLVPILSLGKQGDREKLREARQSRASRYGISAKEDGHLTPPKDYPTNESDYGDPVNYKYPIDASRLQAARSYFNHEGQREAGGYSSAEWAIIGKRIARKSGEGYSYKDGKIVSDVEKAEEFEFTVPLIKADEMRRLVYGIVMVPEVFDREIDIASSDEIERAAHGWMIRGLTKTSNLMDNQHQEILPADKARPVESYIAPVDFEMNNEKVLKGSWILVTHVPDDELWDEIIKGKKQAYSIRGYGRRSSV